MFKKTVYIIFIIMILLLSCNQEKSLHPEMIYEWDYVEKELGISKNQILKNYNEQIEVLKKTDKIFLFGNSYKKIKKEYEKGYNVNKIHPLFSSSNAIDYFKFNDGIYFNRDLTHKKTRQIFYRFYKFNNKKYKFEYINKKISVPHNGPGAMGAEYIGSTPQYIDDKYLWYSSFDTKQFHWWGFDNKYIDTFNMNIDNKHFYTSRTFFMLPKYKKNDLLITPNFVGIGFLKTNKWWLDKPLLYKIDMYDSTYSKIDLDFKIKNEHNHIAVLDNGYSEKETMILMGTEPIILFLNDNYKIIKKIDLKRVYKKYGLEHLYEDYQLTQPWGKIFNVSDEYMLIMTPLFHFSDYKRISFEGIDNIKEKTERMQEAGEREEVGSRKDGKKRLAILINKKSKKVENSEIVKLPVFSNYWYFCGPYMNVKYYILKDMKYIVINLSYTKQFRRLESVGDRKWKNYYYVYKRQKE
ncbi:MAG: hypothetical protein FXF47_10255, partial [Candidatus Mcinerneyibacterium aminivorans]